MPQESGNVNAHREAVVEMRFVQSDAFECVVDTGFDGALILPAIVIERLNLPIVARLVFEVVGGARMSANVALGEIEWLGQRRAVEVILSEGRTRFWEQRCLKVRHSLSTISIDRF